MKHFEARIRTPAGGRHRHVVRAANSIEAEAEMRRWARSQNIKVSKVVVWHQPSLDDALTDES